MIGKLIGATWFRYALIGAALAFVLSVFGWGFSKGYGAAEKNYSQQMNESLARQLKRTMTIAKRDVATLAKERALQDALDRSIDAVPLGACGVPVECLQFYNDIVRSFNANTARTESQP